MAVDADADAPGIVAAVLELAECIEHHITGVRWTPDVSEDATHNMYTP
jgi:hypothetical protein